MATANITWSIQALEIATMRFTIRCMVLLALLPMASLASAADYEVTTQLGLVYAEHDGTKLVGDLYLPKGLANAPALVAIHGGGWQVGNRAFYKYWGPFLARNGYALFSIEYRLGKPGVYPAAVYDAKAAIQFMRAKAVAFGIDPDRIGLIGDSAGGHLAALLALAGDQFTTAYRDDPNATTPANVKAVVAFYGVYDMLAQWEHDLTARPRDNISEKFLGVSPTENRRIYFDSSPISYATVVGNKVHFLLIHGTNDDIVDPPSQSGAFLTALTQAGIFVRRIIIPGAGHFWSSDPFENEPNGYGATVAPRLLRFLDSSL
jgi:acetyl esterase/lipase